MINRSRCGRTLGWLVLAVVVGVNANADNFTAEDGYIRSLLPGRQTTVAFLTITNNLDRDCRLVRVSSSVSDRVEVHRHSHQDGVMAMRPVADLVLPAGEVFRFQPGGYHIMLFGVSEGLVDGESHPLKLHFESCPEFAFAAEVRSVLQE